MQSAAGMHATSVIVTGTSRNTIWCRILDSKWRASMCGCRRCDSATSRTLLHHSQGVRIPVAVGLRRVSCSLDIDTSSSIAYGTGIDCVHTHGTHPTSVVVQVISVGTGGYSMMLQTPLQRRNRPGRVSRGRRAGTMLSVRTLGESPQPPKRTARTMYTRDVRDMTQEERHAIIRAAMSSMSIEGVHVSYDMALEALEIAIARVASGERQLR